MEKSNNLRYTLKSILLGSHFVADRAKDVKLNYDKIAELGTLYASEELELPKWDAPVFPEKADDQTLDFLLLGNAINFAFNNFKTGEKYVMMYKDIPFKGAFGMWAALKNAIDEGIPILDGEYLSKMTVDDAKKIFNKTSEIPMIEERVSILNQVGDVLNEKYGSNFHNVVHSSKGRLFNGGKGLVERLTNDFPSFRDDAIYERVGISFAKRAQLASAMIYEKFLPTGVKLFREEDVEHLSVFADYELPKTLNLLGVLEYSDSLSERIEKGELIPAGSDEEVELRACTIAAADSIRKQISYINKSNKVTALHIDYKLWSEGRNYKDAKAHLTRTTAY